MTLRLLEEDWITSSDPWVLLHRRWPRKTSVRKLNALFPVACWRTVWDTLTPESIAKLEGLEAFFDRPEPEQTQEEYNALNEAVCLMQELADEAASIHPRVTPGFVARNVAYLVAWTAL